MARLLAIVMLLSGLLVLGCGTTEPGTQQAEINDAEEQNGDVPPEALEDPTSGALSSENFGAQVPLEPPTGEVVVYRNADGEIECPVMQVVIESPEAAVGYADFQGKRYYFSCEDCEDIFMGDTAKFAK